MSRIGNKVIVLPAGVEITNNDNVVTVKGPKGELTREFSKDIEIRVEGTEVTLHRPNDSKEMKTIHGTTRALLNNMVVAIHCSLVVVMFEVSPFVVHCIPTRGACQGFSA